MDIFKYHEKLKEAYEVARYNHHRFGPFAKTDEYYATFNRDNDRVYIHYKDDHGAYIVGLFYYNDKGLFERIGFMPNHDGEALLNKMNAWAKVFKESKEKDIFKLLDDDNDLYMDEYDDLVNLLIRHECEPLYHDMTYRSEYFRLIHQLRIYRRIDDKWIGSFRFQKDCIFLVEEIPDHIKESLQAKLNYWVEENRYTNNDKRYDPILNKFYERNEY